MRRRPTIRVFRYERHYVARFSAPDVLETFEQDTLPTAYTADACPIDVLRSVARDNPEADVFLVGTPPSTPPYDSGSEGFRSESPTP